MAAFPPTAAPIAVLGIAGTFLTAAAGAVLAHLAFGLDWYSAALLGTAVSPTDPTVVFSVLGAARSPGVSATSWRASPARTTRSVTR